MQPDKKKLAAIAAVMEYMRIESADIAPAQPVCPAPAAPPLNFWGLAGRQAQMQSRSLMQLKAFHKTTL